MNRNSSGENPNIPKFISQAPWYAADGTEDDTLAHQRNKRKKVEPEWYDRGANPTTQKKVTKFRRGACENCGAMTHKARDCLERPRKKGAKYTHADMKDDEVVKDIVTTYDSKRDPWNGYDASEYKQVMDSFQAPAGSKLNDDDEDIDAESLIPPTEKSRSMRTTEDKASYLTDLNDMSRNYDPKSRKDLRNAPTANEFTLLERKAYRSELSLSANPTESFLKLQQQMQQQQQPGDDLKQSLVDKYGLAAESATKPKSVTVSTTSEPTTLESPPPALPINNAKPSKIPSVQTAGKNELMGTLSKYDEDRYPGNHNSVWGSYWVDHKWGYKCCHSTEKLSDCSR